jgi:hypothetical protein
VREYSRPPGFEQEIEPIVVYRPLRSLLFERGRQALVQPPRYLRKLKVDERVSKFMHRCTQKQADRLIRRPIAQAPAEDQTVVERQEIAFGVRISPSMNGVRQTFAHLLIALRC